MDNKTAQAKIAKLTRLSASDNPHEAGLAARNVIALLRKFPALALGFANDGEVEVGPRTQGTVDPKRFRLIAAKFAGKCKGCAGEFWAGDQVYWARKRGCYCADCNPDA